MGQWKFSVNDFLIGRDVVAVLAARDQPVDAVEGCDGRIGSDEVVDCRWESEDSRASRAGCHPDGYVGGSNSFLAVHFGSYEREKD